MYRTPSTNHLNTFQNLVGSICRPSTEVQSLKLILGFALQSSLNNFTFQKLNAQPSRETNGQKNGATMIEIESQQICHGNKTPTDGKLREIQREDPKSIMDELTSNSQAKNSEDLGQNKQQGRNSAENLNNTLKEQNKITGSEIDVSDEDSEIDENLLMQTAQLPDFYLSRPQIQGKLDQLMKRQVINWKQTSKKEKGELKRLKN